MRVGLDLPNLVSELEYLHENRRDFLVNTKAIKILPPLVDWEGAIQRAIEIQFKRPNDRPIRFPMTAHMLTQIANHTGVSVRLIDGILTKGTNRERQALCDLISVRLQENEAIRMVRTQSRFYEEPVARAFVSDRYREIDHWPLAQAIIPILNIHPHLKLLSAGVTDTHMYLKIVSTLPEMSQNIGTTFNTAGKEVGDILQFGVMIVNSEVGASSVRITPFMYRLACTNGAVVHDVLSQIKKNHIGAKVSGESGEDVTQSSMRDNGINTTFLAAVEVTINNALKDATLAKKIADRFKAAKKDTILGDAEAVMSAIGKTCQLTQNEIKTMTIYLNKNGDMNRFGVINAVTQYAARNKTATYDRVTEIESIGGAILNMGKNLWNQFAVAVNEPTQEDNKHGTKIQR